MSINVYKIQDYGFKQGEKIFFDTNIWFYILFPNENKAKSTTYSDEFKRILETKCNIYVDVLVVSEFINAYARRKWRIVAPKFDNFKDFRNSSEFQPIAEEIIGCVKSIMKNGKRVTSQFELLNENSLDNLLDNYSLGKTDFNDQVISEICKREGMKLVTDDSDFRNAANLTIITANTSMLK